MERRLPSIDKTKKFVSENSLKISGAIASSGLISGAFLSGRADRIAAAVGAGAFCYLVVKGIRKVGNKEHEPKN